MVAMTASLPRSFSSFKNTNQRDGNGFVFELSHGSPEKAKFGLSNSCWKLAQTRTQRIPVGIRL